MDDIYTSVYVDDIYISVYVDDIYISVYVDDIYISTSRDYKTLRNSNNQAIEMLCTVPKNFSRLLQTRRHMRSCPADTQLLVCVCVHTDIYTYVYIYTCLCACLYL